jgi:hypothetical protein
MYSKHKLAKTIYTIGGPFRTIALLGPILIIIKILFFFETISNLLLYILIVSMFSFSIGAYIVLGKLLGFVSDIDLQDIKQRKLFFCFTLISWTSGTLLASFASGSIVYEGIVLVLGILILSFTTIIYKISAHMLLNFILHSFVFVKFLKQCGNIALVYIFLASPWIVLIGWARIINKKHTALQVTVGGIVGLLISIIYITLSIG